jgi:hypothetical protein
MTNGELPRTKDYLMNLVAEEMDNGYAQHGAFNSAHEGLAVLWEEFEELKDLVFTSPAHSGLSRKDLVASMRLECIQIAAVALRFIQEATKHG